MQRLCRLCMNYGMSSVGRRAIAFCRNTSFRINIPISCLRLRHETLVSPSMNESTTRLHSSLRCSTINSGGGQRRLHDSSSSMFPFRNRSAIDVGLPDDSEPEFGVLNSEFNERKKDLERPSASVNKTMLFAKTDEQNPKKHRRSAVKDTSDDVTFGPAEDDWEEDLSEIDPDCKTERPVDRPDRRQLGKVLVRLCKEKKLDEALDYFHNTIEGEYKVQPIKYYYNVLMAACAKLERVDTAFTLYREMRSRGLELGGPAYCGLFNACSNMSSEKGLLMAKRLRGKMAASNYTPNDSNYHSMMKAFGRHGDLLTTFELADEMQDAQIPFTSRTFTFLLQACVTDKEAGFKLAIEVWRKMRKKHIPADGYTYNTLLRACRDCGVGGSDFAHELMRTVKIVKRVDKLGKKEELLTLEARESDQGADIMTNQETVDCGEVVFAPKDTRYSVGSVVPNLLAPRTKVPFHFEIGEIKTAQDRLMLLGGVNGFLSHMTADKARPDVKTFLMLLDICGSDFSREMELLSTMEKHRVTPDLGFCNALIKNRTARDETENAKDVLNMIRSNRLYPDIVTFNMLALSCSTKEESSTFIREMEDCGFKPNEQVYTTLLAQAMRRYNCWMLLDVMERIKTDSIRLPVTIIKSMDDFKNTVQRTIVDAETAAEEAVKIVPGKEFQKSFSFFKMRFKTWASEIYVQQEIKNE